MSSKYVVLWEDTSNKITKQHGVFNSKDEAFNSIIKWWDEHNFKPPYIRTWDISDSHEKIDYGYHHYFYKIVKVDEKEVKEYIAQFPIIPKRDSKFGENKAVDDVKAIRGMLKELFINTGKGFKSFYKTFED